ncbi:hypothetical protein [Achromobacter xylosoxidans]|uniref:hypothetical protein n=1 Tax=Alcaligenes xylosoxydans xylosoxydans TaxID=85698 RepID=UPI0021C0A8B5|nr:hypothetical protein [Achromobacter xylosoxidans]UXL06488.1 hypothetical protein N4T34_07210 [Achromobacter xylosoxidans]
MATRIYKTPFAATGDKEVLATADQPDGKVSLQTGWTPDYELPNDHANYRPVGRAETNGILSEITEGLGEMQLRGFALWQPVDGGWPKGAHVMVGDTVYRSNVDNNTADPAAGAPQWASTAFAGVIGTASNVRCSVAAASASVTFTADEIVVGTSLGGPSYRLANFNKTLNISTAGAGGMDTGAPPTTGWVAVYAIYNPTTGASSIVARNATAAAQPTVYGGINMPAGYTASALISVIPTNASGQLSVLFQQDRKVSFALKTVLTSTTPNGDPGSPLGISSAVPLNAKTVDMGINLQQSALSGNTGEGCAISSSASLIKQQFVQVAGNGVTQVVGWCGDIPIITPQTVWYSWRKFGSTTDDSLNIYVTAYTF